jgi:hypothetical protein
MLGIMTVRTTTIHGYAEGCLSVKVLSIALIVVMLNVVAPYCGPLKLVHIPLAVDLS